MMIYRIVSKISGLILDEGEFDFKSIQLEKPSDNYKIELGFEVRERGTHAYTRKEKVLKVKLFEGDKVINKYNGMLGTICLGKTMPVNSTTPFWGFYVQSGEAHNHVTYSIFDSENECAWQKVIPTEI